MKKRFHRGTSTTPHPDGAGRSHSVHVLATEEELRGALQRAAEFDQRSADVMLARSAHYRALLSDTASGPPSEGVS